MTSRSSRPTWPPTRGWRAVSSRNGTAKGSDPLTLPPGPRTPRALQTARWIARPAAFMDEAQSRYGDMFTLRITHEGTWVFLSHPDAVKQVFTGDPRLLHAGEANVVLLPVLGSNSVLLLDDDAHMAQRKLMLPPFHGERMRGYEQTMADVAARAIEQWPAGVPAPAWPTMQAVTLEVIMRTVFGVRDTERLERLGNVLRSSIAWLTDRRRMGQLALLGARRIE